MSNQPVRRYWVSGNCLMTDQRRKHHIAWVAATDHETRCAEQAETIERLRDFIVGACLPLRNAVNDDGHRSAGTDVAMQIFDSQYAALAEEEK